MKARLITTTLLIIFALIAPHSTTLADNDTMAQRFVQMAVQHKLGPAKDLQVGSLTTSYYRFTDQRLYHAKVTNMRTGQTMAISMDEAGRMIDDQAALQLEKEARRAVYGKLDTDLYELLHSLPQDSAEKLSVSIWLSMDPPAPGPSRPSYLQHSKYWLETPPALLPTDMRSTEAGTARRKTQPELTNEQIDAALREQSQRVQAAIVESARPLLAYLEQRGLTVDYVSQYVPVVYATLTPQAILDLQQRPEVESIGLVHHEQNCLDVARLATYTDWVWDSGFTGWGVRIGVIEVGGRAAVNNPYLWGVSQDPKNACSRAQDHATAVTGMIRSRHVRYRGMAYGSRVRVGGSCQGYSSQLESAAERALNWGAKVLNCSWGHSRPLGEMDSSEKYWDALVALHHTTVCFSAGNSGREDGYVGHPAMAYNVISVGAYDDQNTASWDDDEMATFSSYRDPWSAHGDREKPEVAAPGVYINSTSTRSPWVTGCGSGTSYSSPITAGGAALMMHASRELRSWPEAVKAILMATAWNNIEGNWWLSNKDGAGGIDIQAACATASRHSWAAGEITQASFDSQGNLDIPIHLPANYWVRAVIVWSVDANYSNYDAQPQADLDLYYLLSDGSVFDRSESWDNNYEVVGAWTSGGWRTLRIHAARISTSKPIRLAWAVHWWPG